MERTLRAAGYNAIHAATGLAAIEASVEANPDLIAVAAPLSDLDVGALTLRLRGIPGLKNKPIVVLDDEEGVQDALAVGATGAMPRNSSPSTVVQGIARYIRGDRDEPDESSEIRLRMYSERLAERLEAQIRALQKANVELERLARSRSELLRNVSHELATPLTPALGYVAMLRSGALGEIAPRQAVALESVAEALSRVERVTSMLRDVDALEKDGLAIQSSRFSLSKLASVCTDAFRRRGEELEITLDEDHEVEGDFALIARAVDRVVENARKFSGPESPIAIEMGVDRLGARVVVSDCGPGIAAPNLERIGELFHQVDGSATRRHGGMGLGLAFARRVLEAHGGSVVVLSPPRRRIAERLLTGTEVTLRWGSG